MKLERVFLRGRFARRLFGMFGLAVIIPTILVFWLTYQHAATIASENEVANLRQANKNHAFGVFQRLQIARSLLAHVSVKHGTRSPAGHSPFFADFEELEVSSLRGLGVEATGYALALLPGSDRPRIALLSPSDGRQGTRFAATLDPEFLWGDAEAEIPDGQICVFAGAVRLDCAGAMPKSSAEEIIRDEWELVLAPEFGAPAWRFVATKTRQPSFVTYMGLLLPLALGMLLLALLLSSIEIRRILTPLDSLMRRIKRVSGQQQLDTVPADDEFATLDHAFREMESRISNQIATLETLQKIDELILARVPLPDIVEVVVERIVSLLGERPIALSLASRIDEPARHFVRHACIEAGGVSEIGEDPVQETEQSFETEGRKWKTTQAIGPAFSGLGLESVSYLAVAQRGGPFVRVALGYTGEGPPVAGHADLEKLVERVAVAVTAETRQAQLIYQARHDLLTNLPNRLAVLELLPQLLSDAEEQASSLVVLFIDLDRFKSINDGLGHRLGDQVLAEVSRRITLSVGSKALVARLGGDEFLVIVPTTGGANAALSIDCELREAFEQPIIVATESLKINFSAGIAVYPQDGLDPESLMHNADVAMYRAKKAGGGSAVFFSAEMGEHAVRRVHMENDLRLAVAAGQLHLHYQPRIDSRDGRIIGAEALLRWSHPVLGRIMPDEFIGLAEECGLIVEIGDFAIREACKQLAEWKAAGLSLPLVAVNVSSYQLRAGNLFDTISDALQAHGLSWREIEIEITESMLIKDSSYASDQLQKLRNAGATVAIDDFGTGYSSLAYLTNLPTDTIKIDRTFSSRLREREVQAVVLSIIALATALGKVIVAEGVESVEEVQLLNSWGCHIIQGYVYFPPLAPTQLADELRRRQA